LQGTQSRQTKAKLAKVPALFLRFQDTDVGDFTIPSTFKKQIEQIDVYIVRIIKDSSGKTDRINFYFNFPPITRTIILSYFPNNIPDTLKGNQKYTYNVDWSWSHLKRLFKNSTVG